MPYHYQPGTTPLPGHDAQHARSARSILTRFAVVAFAVVGVTLVAGKLGVDAVIRGVDVADQKDDLTRSRLAFNRLANRARQQVEDYAFWDETVRLAQNPAAPGATGFFRHNFVDWLPRNDYEFIALLDRKRANAFEWTSSPHVRRPAELTSPAILNHLARMGSLGGFVRVGDELYLVGGSTVQPTSASAGATPSSSADGVRGYLVVGGSLQGELLRGLERDLQLGIRILPANTPIPDTPLHSETYSADDSVRIFFPLAGVTGEAAAVIAVTDTRAQQHRFAAWTLYGELIAATLCAIAYLLVWLYGRRLLITPLSAIAGEVVAMHGRGELSTITSPAPSLEWALFLATFNETVRSLRDSEERYGAIFDRAVDPYFLIDARSGLVVDANPAAASLTGEPRDRLVGAPLPVMLRAQPANDTIRVRRPDGTVQIWGVAETEVLIGERHLVLAAYRDLTDREALAQSQKMDAIGSLAGGIAHDFNNLMGSVLAGAQVARGSVGSDGRASAALDAIEHAGRRAAELTKQLLGVARHEPFLRRPVDVRAAMANIQGMCASTFDARIRVTLDAPDRLPAVEGDAGQIEQALLNLCINARDAMPEGGTLALSARVDRVNDEAALTIRDIQPGLFVVLSVADDGVGMSDEIKQRIFEPFFTTKSSGRGTGLGLAMVYGLARNAGGTIVVDSAPNAGSRFHLYLPTSGVSTPMSVPAVPVVRAPRTNGHRPPVILADDEAELREMLRMVLEQEGYDVLEAANGDEAIKLFAARHGAIAAVLLDVQMPVLGGIEACRRIRAMSPETPVILGTGYVGDADLAAVRDAGADDMLLKPYEIRDLLDRLARVTASA
ncbi:MAG TPA: response regulator [Gemmatimonadaceae bacterium]|jgi:signal transduction histidine kinase/CheY-like chemotaxis protein